MVSAGTTSLMFRQVRVSAVVFLAESCGLSHLLSCSLLSVPLLEVVILKRARILAVLDLRCQDVVGFAILF